MKKEEMIIKKLTQRNQLIESDIRFQEYQELQQKLQIGQILINEYKENLERIKKYTTILKNQSEDENYDSLGDSESEDVTPEPVSKPMVSRPLPPKPPVKKQPILPKKEDDFNLEEIYDSEIGLPENLADFDDDD